MLFVSLFYLGQSLYASEEILATMDDTKMAIVILSQSNNFDKLHLLSNTLNNPRLPEIFASMVCRGKDLRASFSPEEYEQFNLSSLYTISFGGIIRLLGNIFRYKISLLVPTVQEIIRILPTKHITMMFIVLRIIDAWKNEFQGSALEVLYPELILSLIQKTKETSLSSKAPFISNIVTVVNGIVDIEIKNEISNSLAMKELLALNLVYDLEEAD